MAIEEGKQLSVRQLSIVQQEQLQTEDNGQLLIVCPTNNGN